ncbi:MAG: hypothetical protein V4519_04700 [Patescibacteria group bacterium]
MAVEFEEDQFNTIDPTMARIHASQKQHSSLTLVLVKKGVFKSEQQAHKVFLIVALVSLLASVFIIGYFVFNIGRPQETKLQLPPEILQKLQGTN